MSYWELISEQLKVKEILNIFLSNRRVPHAFVFSGPGGVGKFNTALQFCKLLYTSFNDANQQNAVKLISNLQEPVLKYIIPLPRARGEDAEYSSLDKLSKEQIESYQSEILKKISNPYHKISIEDANTIKISSIREIKKFINTAFNEFPYRFIIIDDAHFMNEQSQNALLKSLEEPPEGYFFFLLTESKVKLLPTIISRCWNLEFDSLSINAVKNILINNFEVEPELASKTAQFSEGSIHSAIFLLNYNINVILENIISILRYSFGKRYYSAIKELNSSLVSQNLDEIKLIIRLIKIWLNDILKKKYSITEYYFSDFIDSIEKFSDKYGSSRVEILYDKLSFLEEKCEMNLNLNVLFLNLIFELRGLILRN
jgi:DNA polymerase-3 subunit delta'